MWYVAQVQAGRESSTLEMCRRLVPPSVMEDCFMPEYEVMWKIRGEWRLVKRLLFPGYLFFVTDDPEALNRELSRVPMPIRLLGNEENSFFPHIGKLFVFFLQLSYTDFATIPFLFFYFCPSLSCLQTAACLSVQLFHSF